jgi:hypothetical protein
MYRRDRDKRIIGFIWLYLISTMTWCALNYRSFDVRRECLYREYFYLLPAEIIGIKDDYSSEEMQEHLSEFNKILKGFEVCPWFNVSQSFCGCAVFAKQ